MCWLSIRLVFLASAIAVALSFAGPELLAYGGTSPVAGSVERMSEADQVPTCQNCGEPRRKLDIDDARMSDLWVCVNRDCPESGSNLVPISKGEAEKWLNQPGAEGGANGGA